MTENLGGPYGQDLDFVFWMLVLGIVFLCVAGLIEWLVEKRGGR